jgi:thiamine transport system substrate-binding protein
MPRTRTAGLAVAGVALLAPALAACSTTGGTSSDDGSDDTTVTLVTHDSWAVPKKVVAAFEQESGYTLEVLKSGDAGQVTNKLVLTADNPIGDAVYGIDNTYASRALEAGAIAEHEPAGLPQSAASYALPDDQGMRSLTPVDWADVCVNVDLQWFAEQGKRPPRALDDLTDPAYADLFVTPGAATSSPGFAFLLATIGEYGEDGWEEYWERLMANGTRIVSGWSDAYTVDFTAGGGNGDRPIVLSYGSSPPFTIPEGGRRPTTRALLDTCFRQVEYAGVLAGSDNPDGAAALVDFMTSTAFQQALPDNMYVFPVDDEVELPPLWARWATPAPNPIDVPQADLAEHRDDWLRTWSDVTAR